MSIKINGNSAVVAPKPAENQPSALDSRAARTNAAPMPPPAAVPKTAPDEPSVDQVKQAVQDINTSLRSLAQGLEFAIDNNSKRPIVKVIDQRTQEVIRQMPSEQALEFARTLDQVLGKLLSEKA